MALKKVKVPLYDSKGEVKDVELLVDEFAGRMILIIKEGKPIDRETVIEFYFDDLERAWRAVKRY